MAQLLAADRRANRPPARSCGPPGRLVMNERFLPTLDWSYREEVCVPPADMRKPCSLGAPSRKRTRGNTCAALMFDNEAAPELESQPLPVPVSAAQPEPEPQVCFVCLEDLDAVAGVVGCPCCTTLLCSACNKKNQEYKLRAKKPMNECPGCRQNVTRMVGVHYAFASTHKRHKKTMAFARGEPATCILCLQKVGSTDFGCRQCVDFTACEGCFDKIQSMQPIYVDDDDQPLDCCPCCKQPARNLVRYPECMHATGVKGEREDCCLCTRPLGYRGHLVVKCPLCNMMTVHQDCWEKHRRGNVMDDLPENQCQYCGEEAEMLLCEL